YETAKIAPSHISKNRGPALPVLAIDHDRASLNANVGQLPEWNTRTARSINKNRGDIFDGITVQLRKTHEKPEALGSFNYLGDDFAGQRGFDQLLHVRRVQPVACNHTAIHLDAELRQPENVLPLHVSRPRHGRDAMLNLGSKSVYSFQILP